MGVLKQTICQSHSSQPHSEPTFNREHPCSCNVVDFHGSVPRKRGGKKTVIQTTYIVRAYAKFAEHLSINSNTIIIEVSSVQAKNLG
jgi:hypothetical protein